MNPILFVTLTLLLCAPAALAELRLEIDLSARELAVVENGDVIERFPVAIGKESYPTPEGRFSIRRPPPIPTIR